MLRSRARWWKLPVVLAAAAFPAAASLALADAVDAGRPVTLVVGAPRGFAPSERLDGRRTGRAATQLPSPPREAWRRHISGGIEAAPVVDAQGNVLLSLTVPEVVKLGPDGKEIWRIRIGPSAPLAPAVLTSDGTLALVTSAGSVWGITPSGGVRYTAPLGIRGRDADIAPLALDDGGLVIAAGRALLEVGSDGSVRARVELPERAVGGLLSGRSGVIVTTEAGEVLVWRSPGAPRRLGSLGGAPRRGAALVDARTLIAVVDGRRVVALDLPTGTTSVRSAGLGGVGNFDAPPAVGAGGLAITTSQAGLLVGLDAAGEDRIRVLVDRPPPTISVDGGLSGFFGPVEAKPSPPVVVDRDGRVGFVRAGGRVGVVDTGGGVAIASERACSAPVALVPAGEKRMLVACRDGTVILLEQ